MRSVVALGILLSSLLLSCTTYSRRSFDASPKRLRAAVNAVLSHCPGLEEDGNVITTSFCTQPISSEIRRSGANWREWHKVRIVGSTVEVDSTVEETGRHGHGVHRWERRDSRETEEAILEAIALELVRNPWKTPLVHPE